MYSGISLGIIAGDLIIGHHYLRWSTEKLGVVGHCALTAGIAGHTAESAVAVWDCGTKTPNRRATI